MTIADIVGKDDDVAITEKDLYAIIDEALFEESVQHKKIIIDYLMTEKSLDDLALENKLPKSAISRIQGRGRALIKRYLFNNGIILEFTADPMKPLEVKKKNNHRKITAQDYGQIKYLRINFPHFKSNDIAKVLNASSYMISSLLDYPTTAYLKAMPDDSIKEKANQYCNEKYPERIPSEVKIIPLKQLDEVI